MRALAFGRIDEAERLANAAHETHELTRQFTIDEMFAAQIAMIRREQGRLHELAGSFDGLADLHGANSAWRATLPFTLSELGQRDRAALEFDKLAQLGFERIPRDLNWLFAVAGRVRRCVPERRSPRSRAVRPVETLRGPVHLGVPRCRERRICVVLPGPPARIPSATTHERCRTSKLRLIRMPVPVCVVGGASAFSACESCGRRAGPRRAGGREGERRRGASACRTTRPAARPGASGAAAWRSRRLARPGVALGGPTGTPGLRLVAKR